MAHRIIYKFRNMDFYRKCSFCNKEYLVLLRGQPKKDSIPEHNLNETTVLGTDPVTLLPANNAIQRCHYCGKVDISLIDSYRKENAPLYLNLARGCLGFIVLPIIGIIGGVIIPATFIFVVVVLSIFFWGYFGIKNFNPNDDKIVKSWLKWWNTDGKDWFNYCLREDNKFQPYGWTGFEVF
jgi:hypothetical protein